MIGSIVVVGALTGCALLQHVYDLKAAQMNVKRNLIRELWFYEFKLSHNFSEVAKTFVVRKEKAQLITVQ